jgi:hypothetical protein
VPGRARLAPACINRQRQQQDQHEHQNNRHAHRSPRQALAQFEKTPGGQHGPTLQHKKKGMRDKKFVGKQGRDGTAES